MHPCPTRCTSSLIPKQTAIATSLFDCPSVSRRESQRGLSQYVPVLSQSFLLTFPDTCGHVRDVWEQLPDTAFYLPPTEQPSVILQGQGPRWLIVILCLSERLRLTSAVCVVVADQPFAKSVLRLGRTYMLSQPVHSGGKLFVASIPRNLTIVHVTRYVLTCAGLQCNCSASVFIALRRIISTSTRK